MQAISTFDDTVALNNKLLSNLDNFDNITNIFIENTKSNYLENFITKELKELANNTKHNVRNNVGQVSFYAINNDIFTYTIQLSISSSNNARSFIKWTGSSQVLSVKGPGSLTIRKLKVASKVNINEFVKGIKLDIVEEMNLFDGDSISCQSPFEMLEIVSKSGITILESLIVKNAHPDIYWSFNEELKSVFAESSNVTSSRLENTLRIASKLSQEIPRNLVDKIFENKDTNLKIKTMQALILKKDVDVFNYLQESIDSNDEVLSSGAQQLLTKLTN
jgi:hypothetical protein